MAQPQKQLEIVAKGILRKSGPVPVYLPLDPYERKLLDDTAAIFQYDTNQTSVTDAQGTFQFSTWAKDVRQALSCVIYDGDIKANTPEEVLDTWDRVTSLLDGLPGRSSIFRGQLLKSVNSNLSDILKSCEGICIQLIMMARRSFTETPIGGSIVERSEAAVENDASISSAGGVRSLRFWPLADMIAGMMLEPVAEDFRHWSLFAQLLQTIRNKEYFPADGVNEPADNQRNQRLGVSMESIYDDGTYLLWRLIKDSSIANRRHSNGQKVHEFLGKTGFYETHKYLGRHFWVPIGLEKKAEHYKFKVPYDSLEFIPWNELQSVSESYQSLSKNYPKVYWRPESRAKFEYLLYTEEDVYRYCVMNDFYFPDFLVDDKLVFVVRDWQESGLVSNLDDYFSKWHDCAITQTREGNWKVLETIPGMQFRVLQGKRKLVDIFAVHMFSTICEKHRLGMTGFLKETMGSLYDRKLEYVLNAIPFESIDAFHVVRVGSGAHGTVYSTSWQQTSSITKSKDEVVPVALKSFSVPRVTAEIQDYTLSKELQNATFAQQGLGTGVIKLYGLTKSPPSLHNSILPPNTLFLVMEYASLGTLKHHLQKSLNGSESDWEVMYEVVLGLAVGLQDIHESGFVHRDIHWENLLVTRRATPSDPDIPDQLVVLVSDLGEARQVRTIDTWKAGKSYMNTEFRAPYPFDVNTQPADIWTVGCLLLRMSQMSWNLAADSQRQIPDFFLELIDRCMHSSPENVPSAYEIAQFLEDYKSSHSDESYEKLLFTMVPYDSAGISSSQQGRARALKKRGGRRQIPRGI